VLIGGVPKSMKTYSVLNILINAAYGRVHSGLVSGEMNFKALVERFLAAASLVSVSRHRPRLDHG
jgi:replicative DNA helicase